MSYLGPINTSQLPVQDFEVLTLDNGLRLAWSDLPQFRTLFASALASAGRFFEDTENNGVSHFVEHLLHATTAEHPDRESAFRWLSSIPAEQNAHVGDDHVRMYFDTVPDQLATVCQAFARLLKNREYEHEVIESERRLILSELGDTTFRDMGDAALGLIFGEVPFGLPSAGTHASVKKLTANQILEFQSRALRPDQMVVTVVGRIIPAQMDLAANALSQLTNATGQPLEYPVAQPTGGPMTSAEAWSGNSRELVVGFVTERMISVEDRLCYWILASALSHANSIFNRIRYGPIAAYHWYCSRADIRDYGAIYLWGRVARRHRLSFFHEASRAFHDIASGVIGEDEFQAIRAQVAHGLSSSADSASSIAWRIGICLLRPEFETLPSIDEQIRLLATIDRDMLVEFTRRLVQPERMFAVCGAQRKRFWRRKLRREVGRLA